MSDEEQLRAQKVPESLIKELLAFRETYTIEEKEKKRCLRPEMPFFGGEILTMAIAGLLAGENILLCGGKATGKNILAENLSWLFGRPLYDVSFHVNTDSSTLIGTDTFEENEVRLRKGPIYRVAQYGGFGVLDEINMAKNDAVSVLHATLDFRRVIDVPGYDKIDLHPAARFIGTMNYGYAGTKELNEALVSRFLVINMPAMDEERIRQILSHAFPELKSRAAEQLTGLFMDLQKKAENSEISTKPLDLRGLLAAIRLIKKGLDPLTAIHMGVTNKSFDLFEREMIQDIVETRIPDTFRREDVF